MTCFANIDETCTLTIPFDLLIYATWTSDFYYLNEYISILGFVGVIFNNYSQTLNILIKRTYRGLHS